MNISNVEKSIRVPTIYYTVQNYLELYECEMKYPIIWYENETRSFWYLIWKRILMLHLRGRESE